MALRDCFSFQTINTAQLSREFNTVNGMTISATGGRENGPCLKGGISTSVSKTYDAQDTWIIGARNKLDTIPSTAQSVIIFKDGATTHVAIQINTDGTISALRGSTTLATSSSSINGGVSFYIEAKVYIADASGTVAVRINGTSWINFTGDTRNAGNASANNITIGSGVVSNHNWINDLYIADGQAGEVTDFLGPQRCDSLFFTADGYYADWTPSTGSNRYSLVDDNPANDDTDYITGAVGQKVTIKTTSMSFTPATINGVKITGVMKKSASGTVNVKRILRKSSTDYESATLLPPDITYAHISDVLETDPATATAFTKTDIESNIEWGFSVIS